MLVGHLPELILILVVGLIIFGPKRLPELGSSLGSGIREFRKATSALHESVVDETTPALPSAAPLRERDTVETTPLERTSIHGERQAVGTH